MFIDFRGEEEEAEDGREGSSFLSYSSSSKTTGLVMTSSEVVSDATNLISGTAGPGGLRGADMPVAYWPFVV